MAKRKLHVLCQEKGEKRYTYCNSSTPDLASSKYLYGYIYVIVILSLWLLSCKPIEGIVLCKNLEEIVANILISLSFVFVLL